MKSHKDFKEIFLCVKPIDFRMGIFSLSALCQAQLEINPLHEGRLFVFTNRRKNSVKCIYWDRTGFAMWQKILEKEKFIWPKNNEKSATIKLATNQIDWLLNGANIWKIKFHESLNFSAVI